MTFSENLQQVAWTSPSGKTFELKVKVSGYSRKHIGEVKENPRTTISSSTKLTGGKKKSKTASTASTSSSTKRTGDSNDTYTDLGIGGRDVSLDCYFIGETHYVNAQTFADALCEVGKSKLQLAYGDEFTVNVLDFRQSNSLVENINVTIITVNWHQTAETTYPENQTSKTKEIKTTASSVKDSICDSVSDAMSSVTSTTRLQSFVNSVSNVLTKISDGLSVANSITLSSIMTDILGQSITTSTIGTIFSQIGIIMTKAAKLASKVQNLDDDFSLSSTFSTLFGGWDSFISTLQSNTQTSSSTTSLSASQTDNLIINDSVASLALVSAAAALAEDEFTTRAEALSAAVELVELEAEWTEFIEDEISKISDLEDYYARETGVSDVVLLCANKIIEDSCALKVEKTVVLAEDTTLIELAYNYYTEDFYNDPDAAIKYLAQTNELEDDEYFLLKRGSEVKIYV